MLVHPTSYSYLPFLVLTFTPMILRTILRIFYHHPTRITRNTSESCLARSFISQHIHFSQPERW